jgi:hypothetical protein
MELLPKVIDGSKKGTNTRVHDSYRVELLLTKQQKENDKLL